MSRGHIRGKLLSQDPTKSQIQQEHKLTTGGKRIANARETG